MARLAGLPARQVTGYIGGTWTGDGYAVYSTDAATWSEVRLQQNSANGNTDLGWIPLTLVLLRKRLKSLTKPFPP